MRCALLIATLLLGLTPAAAAEYPERPVTLISPFPAGGITDLAARALVEGMRKRFPRGLAVINRPGAGGSLGVTEVVQAAPDGHTLGFTPIATLVVQPQMNDLPYKGPDTYEPVINVISFHQLLAVRGDAPWKGAREFLDDARARSGKLRVGSSGVGTSSHLNLEELLRATGIKVTLVPFSGWAEGSVALLGGHIDALVVNTGEVRPHVDARRLRILAAFQASRNPFYPEVPTWKELGFDAAISLRNLLIAPKGTPPAVVRFLYDAASAAMDGPAFASFARAREIEIGPRGGDQVRAEVWSDYRKHAEILGRLGMLKK